MIIFEKLRWKNLLSSGNSFTELSLNTHNHSLIIGENGAGKSTILDALMFALYGKPFRKINKPQLVNAINAKDMVVECEFKIGDKRCLVRRGIKPSLFEIYVNDTLINLEASSIDYQEYFEKNVLKINYKSFSQIVVLGSASFVPFMQLTAANRREVVEDLLDIQIFSVMNTLLKEKITSNQNALLEVQYQLKNIEDKIELEKRHIKELEENSQEYINEKLNQIKQYEDSIEQNIKNTEAINEEIKDLKLSINHKSKTQSKSKKLVSLSQQLYAKKERLEEEITFFSHNETCPSCSQNIEHDHKNTIVKDTQQKLDTVMSAIKEADVLIADLNNKVIEIAMVESKISTKESDISSKLSQRKIWIDLVKKLKKDVENKESVKNNSDRLTQLETELLDKETLKKQLIEEKSVLAVASTMMKDTGIKSKIISQYVPVINQLINKYLGEMDFFVNFELNESFEETIKSRFRDEFSYTSFSEGEKSRLDLALLFTWRAIAKLRNSASTNLLILDEVFDGSLDNEGSEKLLTIIKSLTNTNNVFIISHKTDSYLDKFDRVIRFQKSKNFSEMNVL